MTVHKQESSMGSVCFLSADDAAELACLETQCFALPWNEAQFVSAFQQAAFWGVGLRQGGRLLAYVTTYHIVDELEILNVAVHPEYRRQGLGRTLLACVLRMAAKRGILHAVLEVRPSNTPALVLYERLGFTRAGSRRGYYPDTGEDALIYTVDLSLHSAL